MNLLKNEILKEKTFVYFVLCEASPKEKYVKIGFAKDPQARLSAFRTSNPMEMALLGCIEGGRELEKMFHQIFGPLRHGNEWFLYTKAVETVLGCLSFHKEINHRMINGSDLTFETVVEHQGTRNTIGEWLCIREMQDRSTWDTKVNR